MSMDEKELNEAICNIMFWYKDTPMAIPQKIVELIIKDRKRICEPLVKAKNLLYGVLCDPEGTVCISGSNGDRKCAQEGMLLIDEVLTLAGLDEGERL